MAVNPRRKSDAARRANQVIRSRTVAVMLLLGVCTFVLLFGKLYDLQINQHEELQEKAVAQQTRSTVITASRGTIYDRNLTPLAISATAEKVFLSPMEIAEYVDLFLFDYKLTDPLLHQKYTGVDNQLILRNLDGLCRKGSRVFLRCPIIPGINDNDEHYQAIAKLSRTYDQILEVNLMTYHDMAKGKAAEIGARYGLMDLKTIEAEEKRKIYERVASFGCRNLKES